MENPLRKLKRDGRSGSQKGRLAGRSPARDASRARKKDAVGRRKPRRQEKPLVMRVIDNWWDRFLNAIYLGSFGSQDEQYDSGNTTFDYVWNTAGLAIWGMQFPILTIVATQLAGVELAGMFSMAFVTANILMYIGNYGVRTYQVSDINEDHSFSDYQLHRLVSVALMLLFGFIYTRLRAYDSTMSTICLGVYLYRAIDAFADVYEGRLQQVDKLYLSGMSQMARAAFSVLVFSLALLITRNIAIASIAMAVAAIVTLIVVSAPMALLESAKSLRPKLREVATIFRKCLPLFAALFLYNLVDNMPKFVMEGALAYDNQLYFNVMYFPAHAIIMITGIIYKPQLVRLANIWADSEQRKRFNLIILAMFGAIALVTVVVALIMGFVGIPVLSVLYGVDFGQFRLLVFLMVIGGGLSASIEFLYQIITVLREQDEVLKLYLASFVVALLSSYFLIRFIQLKGAVIAYIVSMAFLLALLVFEYLVIWRRLNRRSW